MDPALPSCVQVELGSELKDAILNYINISTKFNTTINLSPNSPITLVFSLVCAILIDPLWMHRS